MNLAKALAEGFRARRLGVKIMIPNTGRNSQARAKALWEGMNHCDRLIKEVENRT